jgi:hypothetical protein
VSDQISEVFFKMWVITKSAACLATDYPWTVDDGLGMGHEWHESHEERTANDSAVWSRVPNLALAPAARNSLDIRS